MNPSYFLVFFSLCNIGVVQAEIYKRVDADGHVTYSSEPIKGAKKLYLEPLPTVSFPTPPVRTRNSEGAADFPRVDSATQKNRDYTRKQILEDELATEVKALAEARKKLQEGAENPEAGADKDGKVYRNVARQEEKMSALHEQVQIHEKNIAALKTELSGHSK